MDSRAEAEFTEFMHARWPRLVRLGYGLTGDPGLAEDLAQTALAKAFAPWPRVRRAGDPDAYVRRIMVNANISAWCSTRPRDSRSPSRAGRTTSSACRSARGPGTTPRPARRPPCAMPDVLGLCG